MKNVVLPYPNTDVLSASSNYIVVFVVGMQTEWFNVY